MLIEASCKALPSKPLGLSNGKALGESQASMMHALGPPLFAQSNT